MLESGVDRPARRCASLPETGEAHTVYNGEVNKPRKSLYLSPLLLVAAAAMLRAQTTAPTQPNPPVMIDVDLAKPVGPYKPIYAWFGYDESNYTTAPHGRELLSELHDLSPAPIYIRAHHLFTSGDGTADLKWSSTNVYTEDANGKPIYDFKILDGIFDAYQAAGVRPMVELGFMPKDLAAVLPDKPNLPYQVVFPGNTLSGSVSNPPKDYAKWQELVRVVVAHLVTRYGHDEVLRWYFEVWNEPNIGYWHGTLADYNKLYDYSVAGVLAALPGAKVGGPATTSPRSKQARDFLQGFLDHVNTDKSAATNGPIPLDFITFHAKGTPTIKDGAVTMGIRNELTDADTGFALVHSFPRFAHLPIILSEADPEGCAACSAKTNPANNYRNGTLYPAYTAAAYKRLFDLQDKHGVDLAGMLTWSFEFEGKEFFEGFRSLATNGVDKPVLNVFRMFGMMARTRVATTSTGEVPMETMLSTGVRAAPDVDAMATREGNTAAILLWNYHDAAALADPAKTTVQIHGIPANVKRALLLHYRIDETHSNAYTVWKAMGSPQQPTTEQLARLKAAGQLEMLGSPEWIDVRNGNATVTMELPREGISLLQMRW
jgi:xylan 1,4-beta-xylosidase